MSYEQIVVAQRKSVWVNIARKTFAPSRRECCAVCKRFKSLTHAHHLIPLSIQFDRGFDIPDTNHVWLCPNHHAAVHVLIAHNHRKDPSKPTRACVRLVNEMPLDDLRAVLDISAKAWQ